MKAILVAFLLVPAVGAIAGNLVSGWSPASNNISLRIVCPEALEAGGKDKLFWVKCEIRNEGNLGGMVVHRAKLVLTDSEGNSKRCLRLTVPTNSPGGPAFSYSRPLEAHQTSSWWESCQLERAGTYRLQAVLDELGTATPPVQIKAEISAAIDDERAIQEKLQREFDTFPWLVPNAAEAVGTYRWVSFTNDPVVINGRPYYAFRFKAPNETRRLDWSFVMGRKAGSVNWYILPRENTMQGFTEFKPVSGVDAVPGLTRSSDLTVFQWLRAESFRHGGEYCLWFSPQHGLPIGFMVSLNFPGNELVKYRFTTEAGQERKLQDPK